MTNREFNRQIKELQCPKNKRMDPAKVRALPDDDRMALAIYIVRHRGPLLMELAAGLDESWLAVMGYLHTTKSPTCPEFTFRHTNEHIIR